MASLQASLDHLRDQGQTTGLTARPDDDLDAAFWYRHVRVGVWVSYAVFVVMGLLLLFDEARPGRTALVVLTAAAHVLVAALSALPWKRVIAAQWHYPMIASWTLSNLLVVGVAVRLDGGVGSPFVLLFPLVLVWGAAAYRPMHVVLMGATAVLVDLVAIAGTGDLFAVWARSGALAATVLMCSVIARTNRDLATRLRVKVDELAQLATVDGLTGCANHRTFQERLKSEVSLASRTGAPVAMLLLDLDHFKRVNDEHGHLVGDEVLRSVGRVLRDAARSSDVVARLGGEEFALLLPATDVDGAIIAAERLRRAIGGTREPVQVTASIGVAVLPTMATTDVALQELADKGLYQAKRSGRDRVVALTEDMTDSAHAAVRRRVEDLLDASRVTAVFQPIVDLTTGVTHGYEALARVVDSELSPLAWLDLALQAGVRAELEMAMWDAALDQWEDVQPTDVRLFLNVSPDVLLSPLPWQRVDRLPAGTVLEISERDDVRDHQTLRLAMARWRAAGVAFAVDDVGAGHATLRHVLELSPEYIKLDRSLCREVDVNGRKAELVRSLAGFCERTGVRMIAEGLETDAEMDVVRDVGVRIGQGYGIARPAALAHAMVTADA